MVRASAKVSVTVVTGNEQHIGRTAALLLSVCSGLLMGAAQPALLDQGWLAWIGLVPVLIALHHQPPASRFIVALPCGIGWSVGAHVWYPAMFGSVWGTLLIVAVGCFYAGVLQFGTVLAERLPTPVGVIGLPLAWSAAEFGRTILPVAGDWWFELLAKTQWRFPPALQIVSITGFAGLSFLIMACNTALTTSWPAILQRRIPWASLLTLGGVAVVLGWGWWEVQQVPLSAKPVRVGSIADQANQLSLSAGNTTDVSLQVLQRDITLTRELRAYQPQLIVWPENELADDPTITAHIQALARESGAFLVVDMVWPTPDGLYDAAVIFGPDGSEIGRQAKINVTDEERQAGFIAGPRRSVVVTTPFGIVGLGVCYDRHTPEVTRMLAKEGAQIVAMPADDDLMGDPRFPRTHAADTVLRAVENRVAMVVGNTIGMALAVDPVGRIVFASAIHQTVAEAGQVFTVAERPLYTAAGDWFGWFSIVAVGSWLLISTIRQTKGCRTAAPRS